MYSNIYMRFLNTINNKCRLLFTLKGQEHSWFTFLKFWKEREEENGSKYEKILGRN